jgi:phosphoribosylanthranilate isomerase
VTVAKICGIGSLEQARAALEAGAELLGFVFYPPSHRYLTPPRASRLLAEIRAERPHGWRAVGLFVNEPLDAVQFVARRCALDLVQLSGDEDRAYCRSLRLPFVKVLRPERLTERDLAEQARAAYWGAERVLLDAAVDGRYGGTGRALDWSALRSFAGECLLAGGLTPDNVAEAVRVAQPWGVDVSSGVEFGRAKDPDLIRRFLFEVQRADEQCAAGSGV